MFRKRTLILFTVCLLLLSGCSAKPAEENASAPFVPDPSLQSFSLSFLDLFDTVTYVKGYAKDAEAFRKITQAFYDQLLIYHKLYDIYNDYDGVINVKYLNDHAGECITVDPELMDLLLFSRDISEKTSGKVDITLGAVLRLWHEAREDSMNAPENAHLPDADALTEAKKHTGFDKLELNAEKNTVKFLDPLLRLDVGAIAKGYAAQKTCAIMGPGLLFSVGGNIVITGPKPDSGKSWIVGVQDPLGNTNDYLHKLSLNTGCVVSSGDYQRYFTYEGRTYHHIIDPDTLFPSTRWHGVTVICDDSGIADGLSTALFLSSLEEGKELLRIFHAEAVWVDMEGNEIYSDGYKKSMTN